MSAQSKADPQWNEALFSFSVNRLLTDIDRLPEGADLSDLMQIMRGIHPDYGQSEANGTLFERLIGILRPYQETAQLPRYAGSEWISKVQSITTNPKNFDDINGRMFVIAALLAEQETVVQITGGGLRWREACREFVVSLENELLSGKNINFGELLTPYGLELRRQLDERGLLANTRNISDAPTRDDALSRRTLAQFLAKRLRYIYRHDVEKGQAFFMHIDGAWGSGKSTLLGFLQEALEADVKPGEAPYAQNPSESGWIVVNFNAWENQRLDPPWWFLLKAMHRQAMQALWKRGDFRRWLGVGLTERLWRLNPGGRNLQWAILGFFIFLFARYSGVTSEKNFNELPLVQLITFLIFIGSIAKAVGSMLLSGSSKAAQAFVDENSSDPMNRLTLHYNKLIAEIGYPVAIFIDDLDRCNKEYGVKLLEGLQTIYKNAPVVYVIAADRKWLSTMYESQYSLFAPAIMRPAKPLGLVFLDKIFQWIVELPEISAAQKKVYWDSLLNIRNAQSPANTGEIEQKILDSASLKAKMNVVDETDDPIARQFAREKVVESLSVTEEEQLLEHKLQGFLSLIEPNPRAMKRLVNDVSTAKAMSILYNQRIDEEQLILWMILKQQYPDLARSIWETPDVITDIKNRTGIPKAYEELLARAEVMQLFEYSVNGQAIHLDLDFINTMKFKMVQQDTHNQFSTLN